MWAWLTGGAFVVLFIVFNVISSDDDQEETVAQSTPTPLTHSSAPVQNHASNEDIAGAKTDIVKTSTVKERAATTAAKTNTPASKVTATVKAAPVAAIPPGKKATKVETTTVKHISKTNKPASASPTTRKTASPRKQASKTPAILNKAATVPPQQMNKAAQPATTARHVFRFEAVTAPIWMQVFLPNKAGDGKGRLLKEMLLKKGHFANIRYATETLWITCGNALALRIKVDHKTIVKTGGLGNGKKVLRDYRFDINDL